MLMKRVITAIVLLIIFSAAIAFGPLSFAGVMAIAFGAVLFEWLRMAGLGPRPALLVAAQRQGATFTLKPVSRWKSSAKKITNQATMMQPFTRKRNHCMRGSAPAQ